MTASRPRGPTGNTYDKYASTNPIEQRMMRGFMAALDGMLDGLAPQRILEIGVGEGHVMRRVRERFPGVPMAGLDLPDEALSDEWEALGLPCLFGDATALPFPDGGFDLVLAIEVLEHVPRPERGAGRAGPRLPRHAHRLGPVRADLAGRQHGPAALRPGLGQHTGPRQPLDPLGLPPVRRRPLRRDRRPQSPAVDDGPGRLPLTEVTCRASRSHWTCKPRRQSGAVAQVGRPAGDAAARISLPVSLGWNPSAIRTALPSPSRGSMTYSAHPPSRPASSVPRVDEHDAGPLGRRRLRGAVLQGQPI